MANFTVTFNIGEIPGSTTGLYTWAAYQRFIEALRRDHGLGVRFSHNLPVLRPEQKVPSLWFDVVLQTDQNVETTFRIRGDNLYLVGYRMQNGQWLEFTNDAGEEQHLIPGSKSLKFGGSYDDLKNKGGTSLLEVEVSQINLSEAVTNLATATTSGERAKSLMVVILMICEALRFRAMSNFITTNFQTRTKLTTQLERLVHGWGTVSTWLLQADANPEQMLKIPSNDMGIKTMEEAVNALGMVKDTSADIILRTVAAAAVAAAGGSQYGPGQPLVEVFSVTINNIDEKNPGQLYGTIKVTDGLTSQNIYNRESLDYESIIQGKTCTLTGPSRCISAYDSFTIDLDLWNYGTTSPSDEVSRGQITWNVFDPTKRYDQLLVRNVDGKYGSSTVNYAVFSNAVQATVEVTLIDGDSQNPANVYGMLAAQNDRLRHQIVLFKRESDKYIDVKPGARIPLSRSAVVVSFESSLTVQADLYHFSSLSPDDEIAKGSAVFTPQLSGTDIKYITGKYGKIEVKVNW